MEGKYFDVAFLDYDVRFAKGEFSTEMFEKALYALSVTEWIGCIYNEIA